MSGGGPTALAARYEATHPAGAGLHEFQQSGVTYLFDLASAVGLPQEDRTVAAWTLTPAAVAKATRPISANFRWRPARTVDASAAPGSIGQVGVATAVS